MNATDEKAALQLQEVRQWARDKIAGGQEPPWAWFQYMKLIETADAILAGMNCVTPTGNSQQLPEHLGKHLRLVAEDNWQDTAQRHPDNVPIPLPM